MLIFAEEGPVYAALHRGVSGDGGARFRAWLDAWQQESGERLAA